MPNPLKICYRADFHQPQGDLNPMRLQLSAPITVELYLKAGPKWIACKPGYPKDLFPITPQATIEAMKACLPGPWFEKQLTPWKMYEITEPSFVRVAVNPDDMWQDRHGKWFQKSEAVKQIQKQKAEEQQQKL